jgi:translocation and assembly module TamB
VWYAALRWILAGGVVAVCLAAAAALVIRSGWIEGQIREAIVQHLTRSVGRPVAVGRVDGDLWHEIDLHDLVIAERGGWRNGILFSVDRVRLRIDLPFLLRHPDAPLASIVQADLDGPRLSVARDSGGTWNLKEFIKSNASNAAHSVEEFRGRIVIHDGRVAYADSFGRFSSRPFTAHFARLEGVLDYKHPQQVGIALRALGDGGEAAAAHGQYLPAAETMLVDITARDGRIARWGGYFVRLKQLRWVTGRFDGLVHVLATPSRTGLIIDYAATLRLLDAGAEYGVTKLRLRHATGTITLDGAGASTPGLALQANGSPLRLRGGIAYPGGTWLNLVVSSPGLDLGGVRAMFFPGARLGLAGQASGDVWITGPWTAPYLDGDIIAARGRLNRLPFSSLRTRFQYEGGMLAFSALSADLGSGAVSGDATLDVSSKMPSYAFAGSAQDLDLQAFPAAGLNIIDGVAGRVSGGVVGIGRGHAAQVMADLAMGPGLARGQAFDAAHVFFWDDDGSVDVDALTARVGPMTVHASGRIDSQGALDLAVDASNVPLSWIGEEGFGAAPRLDGLANFDGHLGGTMALPVVGGDIAAWDGRIGPVPFAFAKGNLEVSRREITTKALDLLDGATHYYLAGGLALGPMAAENLRVDADNVNAEPLSHEILGSSLITGTLSGDLIVNGPLARPAVLGSVSLTDGSVAGQHVDWAVAQVSGGGHALRLLGLDAQVNGSHLYAIGSIDPAGPIDLAVSAEQIRLEDVNAALGLGVATRGTVSLSGTIGGTFRDPDIHVGLASDDFSVRGQTFQASGTVSYRQGLLRVSPLELAQGDARYTFSGVVRTGTGPSADLSLAIEHGQIATLLAAGGLSAPVAIDGTLDGTLGLTGPLADPSAELSLTLSHGRVGGVPIEAGTADLSLGHGALEIRQFELDPGQGQLTAKGRVDLGGASAVEVSAQNLDPSMLGPLLHLDQPLAGLLNFTLQFTGPTSNPTAGLSLEALNVGVPGAIADRIIGLAYYQDGMIHIEDAQVTKGPHAIVVAGTLPVSPGGLSLDPQGPISLALHLQETDLSLLTLLAPQIQSASGTVLGEVNVSGTVGAVQMSGFIRAQGGTLQVAPLRTPIKDVGIDIAFSQDEILVRDLSATIGGGPVRAHGTVSVGNFRPENMTLDLAAQHLLVDVPGLYTGGMDATLSLHGSAPHPVLSGTATLSNGQVTIGVAPQAPATRHALLALDVNVLAGGNVRFNQGAVRALLGGSVHLGGTVGDPRLSGRVQSVNGTISILGKTFTLTDGQAIFSEALGLDPQVSARAQANYGQTRVYLDVRGVMPSPDVLWSSDPPLSQQDILSLVAGTGAPGLAGQELGRLLLGSFSQSIGQFLRLDEVSISGDSQNPVTLRIGKFIVNNLYLSVSEVLGGAVTPGTLPPPGTFVRLNANGQAYTVFELEDSLSPNVYLSYNVDTLGDNGVFLLGRIPFW